jgi:molecular chaperone DnaK
MAADNRLLSQFNLEGIPPAPRGVPQIEVKFDIDANGILNVAAKDLGTGVEQTVRIEQSSGLSESEIEKMRKDAESHADEDKKKRALIEARNEGESRCYQLEKLIKQQGDKLKDSDKSALEAAIAKVREAAKGDDAAKVKSAIGELEAASHAMSEALYKTAAGAAPGATGAEGAAAGTTTPPDEDTIDAEFEVKS